MVPPERQVVREREPAAEVPSAVRDLQDNFSCRAYKLRRLSGVSGAGARCRNPERSEGPHTTKLSCWTCKPNSVPPLQAATVIPLGGTLLRRSSDLPGSCGAPSRHAPAVHSTHAKSHGAKERRGPPLFGLAPCGVFPAIPVTQDAVRSYRTFSPLPRQAGAVCFLWHFPSTAFEGRCPDVIRHTALWSSDFPLPACAAQPKAGVRRPAATVRPSS